jgi:hypothetical protein
MESWENVSIKGVRRGKYRREEQFRRGKFDWKTEQQNMNWSYRWRI